ncbi:MAG: hypothetical protein IPK13_24205 [Deltaproteobacteria bacterium]|nr:hypothetical protein [Deltaproteobacteria bacterium]
MSVRWYPGNNDYYASRAVAARNVVLATQGASGSLGHVNIPGGIDYYVDAAGNPTAVSATTPRTPAQERGTGPSPQ